MNLIFDKEFFIFATRKKSGAIPKNVLRRRPTSYAPGCGDVLVICTSGLIHKNVVLRSVGKLTQKIAKTLYFYHHLMYSRIAQESHEYSMNGAPANVRQAPSHVG